MGRFCLRYQAVDLRLSSSEFVVGRAPECDLVLDDTLVSRKHASFRVDGDSVEVRDLGSRNGVLVNNKRVDGTARMQHGDRALIGAQELLLKDVDRTRPVAGTAELTQCTACGSLVQSMLTRCSDCGAEVVAQPGLSAASEPDLPARERSARPVGSLGAVAQLAEKSFALGRHDEAERMLSGPLQSLLGRAESQSLDADTLDAAAHFALRLADELSKGSWVDYVFELFTATGTLMGASLVEELYKCTERLRHTNVRSLRNYLTRIRADADSLGASERFLLQRLDGLERRMGG